MLIPFKDDNPIRITPYVTYGIFFLNILVFLFESLVSLFGGSSGFTRMIYQYGLIPADVFHGGSLVGSIYPFFTSIFLHGGILHIAGNMLYFWIFADNIESELGHTKFLIFYLVCGVAASLTQMLMDWNSVVPIIGASGAISGVLGAYYLRFPHARVKVLLFLFIIIQFIWIPANFVLGFWFLLQVISGLGTSGGGGGGVAFFAHIGGFVAGIVFFNLFYGSRLKVFNR